MNNRVNVSDLGVHINFPTWEKFNLDFLTNDGVVLFQYLVFHCQNNAEWTHSDEAIKEELGLKRSRLSALRKKFIEAGILETRIVENQYKNKVTAYRLNFTALSKPEKIRLIYRQKTLKGQPVDFGAFSSAFKSLAQHQPKLGSTPAKVAKASANQSAVEPFAQQLEKLFVDRQTRYNQKKKEGEAKSVGTLKFSPAHLKKLANALNHFSDRQYISNAFIAFSDALLELKTGSHTTGLLSENPRSPLSYFLSYSNKFQASEEEGHEVSGSYAIIYRFGEYYTGHYHSR